MHIGFGIIAKYDLYDKIFYRYSIYTTIFAIMGIMVGILWTKLISNESNSK